MEQSSLECRKGCLFVSTALNSWLKKTCTTVHSIRNKIKSIHGSLACVFQCIASTTCNFWVLTGSLVCSLWLARLITFVLVLQHAITICSNWFGHKWWNIMAPTWKFITKEFFYYIVDHISLLELSNRALYWSTRWHWSLINFMLYFH